MFIVGVRTYVRTYARTCVHTYVRTHIRTYVRNHTRAYVRTYERTYVRTTMMFLLCEAIVPPGRMPGTNSRTQPSSDKCTELTHAPRLGRGKANFQIPSNRSWGRQRLLVVGIACCPLHWQLLRSLLPQPQSFSRHLQDYVYTIPLSSSTLS